MKTFEVTNPNNCQTCEHIKNPDGGHCYMFKDEPKDVCMVHTIRSQQIDLSMLFRLCSKLR